MREKKLGTKTGFMVWN